MKKTARIFLYLIIITIFLVTLVLTVKNASKSRQIAAEGIKEGTEIIEEKPDMIKVYVTGEVMSPGIVEIERGSTILDAVKECGGFTDDASSNINLVYPLEKNVTLIIKDAADGGGAGVMDEPGNAVIVNEENGLIDGMININEADVKSLVLLPGIGEKTAGDIIAFREAFGPFEKTEDIMKVPGIKESKFEKIKQYICID